MTVGEVHGASCHGASGRLTSLSVVRITMMVGTFPLTRR
jgi:hypothetical protein